MSNQKLYTNGPLHKDFVSNAFSKLINGSSCLWVAAPFVTQTEELVRAAKSGKSVKMIVGLNMSTSPDALLAARGIPNIEMRYFTGPGFHAKIYISENAALVGSSNLTEGGFKLNREATISLCSGNDKDAIEEVKAFFVELWQYAEELTPAKLSLFAAKHREYKRPGGDLDKLIGAAVGEAEPPTIKVGSTKKPTSKLFLKQLQHLVYSQYQPAFNSVAKILSDQNFRRSDLADLEIANETNLFLSWVRLSYAPGETIWKSTPLRTEVERLTEIRRLGSDWTSTSQPKVSKEYRDWLKTVRSTFGTRPAIAEATKEQLSAGFMAIHAFHERLRFVKGGATNLPEFFWAANNDDIDRVKKTLTFFLFGDTGDFTLRLHDVLYDPQRKLGQFGQFSALELYGTIRPNECPPLNGRIAKALRYIGFDVPGE